MIFYVSVFPPYSAGFTHLSPLIVPFFNISCQKIFRKLFLTNPPGLRIFRFPHLFFLLQDNALFFLFTLSPPPGSTPDHGVGVNSQGEGDGRRENPHAAVAGLTWPTRMPPPVGAPPARPAPPSRPSCGWRRTTPRGRRPRHRAQVSHLKVLFLLLNTHSTFLFICTLLLFFVV